MERKIDAMYDNFGAFATGLTRSLAEAFAQQGTMLEWPQFGTTVPYPPPDLPPEEGGSVDH